jgi:hypothetical protein
VHGCTLLSFERPARGSPPRAVASSRTLKTAQLVNNGNHRGPSGAELAGLESEDHRQDVKGTWWMPWHQELMKDVNGCDKPRVGAE